jgi:hypothetical protein
MLNPLDAPRGVWCRVCADDVERIDRLVDKVNCRTPWGERVTRTEVLRALVRRGLDLATLRVFAVDYLKEEPAQKLRFKLLPSEVERVTSLQKDYVEGLSNVAKPPLASLHRALISLGLLEAERDGGFLSFAEEVKLSRWLWRASQRRGRGAAEARPRRGARTNSRPMQATQDRAMTLTTGNGLPSRPWAVGSLSTRSGGRPRCHRSSPRRPRRNRASAPWPSRRSTRRSPTRRCASMRSA